MVCGSWRRSIHALLLVKVEIVGSLLSTASHADIATDTNPATLLCDNPAQRRAGGQSRELLGTVDGEGNGFHFETEVQRRLRHGGLAERLSRGVGQSVLVSILGVLDLFVQVKAQTVATFVAHGQVGKDKVASLRGTIQIGDSGHRHTSQNRTGRRASDATMGDGTSGFQGSEEEEIGIIGKGDVGFVQVGGVRFVDTQFDNRGRVDRSTVRRG